MSLIVRPFNHCSSCSVQLPCQRVAGNADCPDGLRLMAQAMNGGRLRQVRLLIDHACGEQIGNIDQFQRGLGTIYKFFDEARARVFACDTDCLGARDIIAQNGAEDLSFGCHGELCVCPDFE